MHPTLSKIAESNTASTPPPTPAPKPESAPMLHGQIFFMELKPKRLEFHVEHSPHRLCANLQTQDAIFPNSFRNVRTNAIVIKLMLNAKKKKKKKIPDEYMIV